MKIRSIQKGIFSSGFLPGKSNRVLIQNLCHLQSFALPKAQERLKAGISLLEKKGMSSREFSNLHHFFNVLHRLINNQHAEKLSDLTIIGLDRKRNLVQAEGNPQYAAQVRSLGENLFRDTGEEFRFAYDTNNKLVIGTKTEIEKGIEQNQLSLTKMINEEQSVDDKDNSSVTVQGGAPEPVFATDGSVSIRSQEIELATIWNEVSRLFRLKSYEGVLDLIIAGRPVAFTLYFINRLAELHGFCESDSAFCSSIGRDLERAVVGRPIIEREVGFEVFGYMVRHTRGLERNSLIARFLIDSIRDQDNTFIDDLIVFVSKISDVEKMADIFLKMIILEGGREVECVIKRGFGDELLSDLFSSVLDSMSGKRPGDILSSREFQNNNQVTIYHVQSVSSWQRFRTFLRRTFLSEPVIFQGLLGKEKEVRSEASQLSESADASVRSSEIPPAEIQSTLPVPWTDYFIGAEDLSLADIRYVRDSVERHIREGNFSTAAATAILDRTFRESWYGIITQLPSYDFQRDVFRGLNIVHMAFYLTEACVHEDNQTKIGFALARILSGYADNTEALGRFFYALIKQEDFIPGACHAAYWVLMNGATMVGQDPANLQYQKISNLYVDVIDYISKNYDLRIQGDPNAILENGYFWQNLKLLAPTARVRQMEFFEKLAADPLAALLTRIEAAKMLVRLGYKYDWDRKEKPPIDVFVLAQAYECQRLGNFKLAKHYFSQVAIPVSEEFVRLQARKELFALLLTEKDVDFLVNDQLFCFPTDQRRQLLVALGYREEAMEDLLRVANWYEIKEIETGQEIITLGGEVPPMIEEKKYSSYHQAVSHDERFSACCNLIRIGYKEEAKIVLLEVLKRRYFNSVEKGFSVIAELLRLDAQEEVTVTLRNYINLHDDLSFFRYKVLKRYGLPCIEQSELINMLRRPYEESKLKLEICDTLYLSDETGKQAALVGWQGIIFDNFRDINDRLRAMRELAVREYQSEEYKLALLNQIKRSSFEQEYYLAELARTIALEEPRKIRRKLEKLRDVFNFYIVGDLARPAAQRLFPPDSIDRLTQAVLFKEEQIDILLAAAKTEEDKVYLGHRKRCWELIKHLKNDPSYRECLPDFLDLKDRNIIPVLLKMLLKKSSNEIGVSINPNRALYAYYILLRNGQEKSQESFEAFLHGISAKFYDTEVVESLDIGGVGFIQETHYMKIIGKREKLIEAWEKGGILALLNVLAQPDYFGEQELDPIIKEFSAK